MKISCSLPCIALALVACAGCSMDGGAEADGPLGAAQQALDDPPRGLNGKHPGCMEAATAVQAYHLLGASGLNDFPYISDIDTTCRTEVIQNAVQCALREGQSVVDPFDRHTYTGWWGLATGWATAPLGTDDQQWVTACMIQRLNHYGTPVPILLEGSNSAITPSQANEVGYPFQESFAWGNIFNVPVTGQFQIYVCYKDDLQALCSGTSGGSVYTWFNSRICDTSPVCNLNIVGNCNSVCTTMPTTGQTTCLNPDGTYTLDPVEVRLQAQSACVN